MSTINQQVDGSGNIFSGTGNVTVNNIFCRLLGRIFTSGNQSPAINAEQGNVTVTYNNSVIPPQRLEELAGKLAVTEAALASFFKILEEQQVAPGDLDSKLREIATQHKELLSRMETVQSADPQVVRLKGEARQAIEAGEYAKAEELLNQAEARDMQAIEELEQTAKQRRISAAASCGENAILQRIQLHYAKAAEYWQKAADLLPEESKKARACCLDHAGCDLLRIANYKEALALSEQSLVICREIDDKAGESATLNNICSILHLTSGKYAPQILHYLEQSLAISREINDRDGEYVTLGNIGAFHIGKGNYVAALKYLEQNLFISREIGDKEGEGGVLNNIATIASMQRDYTAALKHLEQSLFISRETGNRAIEGTTLNNIAMIYYMRGDYAVALCIYEQSITIRQEIRDRRGEAETSWNIGRIYYDQHDLAEAGSYINQAVQIAEEIGHPKLNEWRGGLVFIRIKLWWQRLGLFAWLLQWLRRQQN